MSVRLFYFMKKLLTFTILNLVWAVSVYSQSDFVHHFIVEGVVYDSTASQPVEGAQIWIYSKQAGDITNSSGRFHFDIHTVNGNIRAYIRICGRKIATSKLLEFEADTLTQTAETLIQTNFVVSKSGDKCASPPPLPWKVKLSSAKVYSGYIDAEIHGIYFETCNDKFYLLSWPKEFVPRKIRSKLSKPKFRMFIRFKGKLNPYTKNVVPGPTVYVLKLLEQHPANEKDCSSKRK